jgi:hypothetical protein
VVRLLISEMVDWVGELRSSFCLISKVEKISVAERLKLVVSPSGTPKQHMKKVEKTFKWMMIRPDRLIVL